VPDSIDNCPTVPNASQANNDGDALGDACDPDDDNDGLLDVEEPLYGTNPFLGDTDGDGAYDGDEVEAGTNPLDDRNYPGAPSTLPGLGLWGSAALCLALAALGWRFQRRRLRA
jgi:hypothetical protein